METKKIEIEVPEGKTAEWIDGVLKLVDDEPKDTRPVTERIKTFDDACRELGESHPLVVQHREIFDCFLDGADERNSSDLIAYMKLRIICAALNEGWEPKFTKDEYGYYPLFIFYSKREIDDMDEDERNELALLDGDDVDCDGLGFICVHSSNNWSYSGAVIGFRLFLKSEELAVYCGKQFFDIWSDYDLN